MHIMVGLFGQSVGGPSKPSYVRASRPFCPISSVAIQHKELRDWVVKSIACGHQCIKMCRQRDTHVLTQAPSSLTTCRSKCRRVGIGMYVFQYSNRHLS